MAKVTLGKKPASFKPFPVKFPMPDGSEGVISATFKYRTRSEFGVMLNEIFKDAKEEKADGAPDFEDLFSKIGDKNADHLLACMEGWDMDVELNRANLVQLSDEIPAASAALMAAYRGACVDGALGN
jgi:hypothetical protein